MRLRPKTPLRPRPSKRAAPARLAPALRTPLYHQIYILLREQIMSGTYGDDALLPTEFSLARTYGVSRITAKRALDELKAEGLVERRRGRGTSVAKRVESRPVHANLSGLI